MQKRYGGFVGSNYLCVVLCLVAIVNAEDPYRFFTWNVTYGDIYPMGVLQQVKFHKIVEFITLLNEGHQKFEPWVDSILPVFDKDWSIIYMNTWILYFVSLSWRFSCLILQGILINGQFPGPEIYSVTNDNLIINVFNNLPEPFLISW